METQYFGKLLIFIGVFIVVTGLIFTVGPKIFNFGGLPGDIVYKRGNFTFFFPLATSIVISIVLTVILNLILRK